MAGDTALVPLERIERAILVIRGQKVLLDVDLADLYAVETRALTQAVRRNAERFPTDFMFQLSDAEFDQLRAAEVIAGARRYRPYAFTEQGVAMLSSVLRSPRAVEVNIEIMRAFVRLRQMLSANEELAAKIDTLERRYDEKFKIIFQAIRQLMAKPDAPSPAPLPFRPKSWD